MRRLKGKFSSNVLCRLLLACACLALAGLAACSSSDNSNSSGSPSAGASRAASTSASASPAGSSTPLVETEPLKVVRATLEEINNNDLDTAYSNLSQEARKEVSLDDAKRVLDGLKTSGITFSVDIDKVSDQAINGDFAEIGLTLRVHLGETNIPVEDASSLVREDGAWKISDHFLQTALAAVGLAKPIGQGPRVLDSRGCAVGDPMEGVYAPKRLQVLDPCITVTGTVRNDITNAEDGDITFGLYLSDADKRLINDVNVSNYDSALHIEIVPEDQALVATPQPGQKVRITGPWVTDLAHGHNEIHPAFKIEVLP